jgi:hypothetical protein
VNHAEILLSTEKLEALREEPKSIQKVAQITAGCPVHRVKATQPLLPDSSSLCWWRIAAIR